MVTFPPNIKKKTTDKNKITTEIYQATLLHKEFAQSLNVVIIVKTNHRTSSQSHVILFSRDVKLSYETIIDYYGLRFQIEFNFRDAKQFRGLEDFMNIQETGVTNSANLSFFMVNLSHYLLKVTQKGPLCSVRDLKSQFRGYRYAEETIKLLKEKPDPVLLGQILKRLSSRSAVSINIPKRPVTIKLAKVLTLIWALALSSLRTEVGSSVTARVAFWSGYCSYQSVAALQVPVCLRPSVCASKPLQD